MRGPEVSPPLSRAGSRSITGDAGDMPKYYEPAKSEEIVQSVLLSCAVAARELHRQACALASHPRPSPGGLFFTASSSNRVLLK
jgi:hypothetical protein